MKLRLLNIMIILACTCGMISCQKEWTAELAGDPPRLFRPVIKGSLQAPGNYIELEWQQSKETNTYKVEVSVDSFKTVSKTLLAKDTTMAIVDDLLWERLYQVRMTAVHISDSSKNSLPAEFGEIKTPRFPTIVETPITSDVGFNSILFKWRDEGDEVTLVKVVDTESEDVVKSIPLSQTDIANKYILIEGLVSARRYTVELYSDDSFRGSNTYRLREPLNGDIIDLTQEDASNVNLAKVISEAGAGATILLKRGAIYEVTSSVNFSKDLTLLGNADPLVPDKPKIHISGISNFGIAQNATITKLEFNDVELYSNDGASKYIFNPNLSAGIDSVIFRNSEVHHVRGIVRLRGGLKITHLTIDNSIIHHVGGYGVLTVDDANSAIDNLTVKSSTLYNAERFVVSKNNAAGQYNIINSTFYGVIQSAQYFIDFNGTSLSVAGGILLEGVVFGRPMASTGTPATYDIGGIRINPNTAITAQDNFATSDFAWRENSQAITPSVSTHIRSSAEVFADPSNADFTIKDNGFGGIRFGDPRWR